MEKGTVWMIRQWKMVTWTKVDNKMLNIKRHCSSDDYDISYGNVLCAKKNVRLRFPG